MMGLQQFSPMLVSGGVDEYVHTITSSVDRANLRTIADANSYAGEPIVTISLATAIDLYSTTTATAACTIGTWPAGTSIKIIMEGTSGVRGKGGDGGNGPGAGNSGNPGNAGGDAFDFGGNTVTVDVGASGEIFSGGGGGGSGGGGSLNGEGGGGGGAGNSVGLGATGGSSNAVGTNGTETAGGNGGTGAFGGDGGNGGAPGVSGSSGTSGTQPGGAGAAPGKAINLGGGAVVWVGGTPSSAQLKGAVS